MSFRLVIDVSNEGHGPVQVGVTTEPAPSRTVIEFDLPNGATEQEAKAIARGIRRAYREVFDSRVKVVGFQEVGLSRDVEIGAQ